MDIEYQTIQDTDIYGYKRKASPYVDIELQTIKYPDVCGHKYQPCVYMGIGKHVQSLCIYIHQYLGKLDILCPHKHQFVVCPHSHNLVI